MSKFEINPNRGRRVWAILFAITGIAWLFLSHRASGRVFAGVMLLSAWDLAFLPSLPFNLTLGQIYQNARQGWRMSLASRAINYLCFALIILSIYLQMHGR
jgi:hypothetical protein